VNTRIDNQGRFFVTPQANWNGNTRAIVRAADGRGGVALDTVRITVLSVNDLPSAFTLVSPRDSAFVHTSPSVRFEWEASRDVVEDSTVRYSMIIFFNGQRHYYPPIRNTVRNIARNDLVGVNPNVNTLILWWVYANDGIDSVRSTRTYTLIVPPLSVDEDPNLIPTETALGPVYPNPFNDRVTIGYSLPKAGMVILTVHDQLGRTVRTLASAPMSAGHYEVSWDGMNSAGSKVTTGVYFCRLITPQGVKMERLVLLR